MRRTIICVLVALVTLSCVTWSFAADEQIQVYPVQALFVSDKAKENEQFRKAISSDNLGTDRKYAVSRFLDEFKKQFPNYASTINDRNKYSTFAVFLQIPRVSQYKIVKSDTLVDLYLPMTMTVSFANMGTGEVLYTYTYTYYSKREATFASLKDETVTSELYRETFDSLLQKVILNAKENFKPFTVSAVIKKEWQGLYLLDKGDSQGVIKGDTLVGPGGLPLTVVYAAGKYSVAQPIMGEPKIGMAFTKLSNGNMDEMKKPKVMLMPGVAVKNGTNLPEQMIYQLFTNALGKNAAFSLISIDKGFYDVQRVVTQETGLTQAVTQQRELPEYYLRLQFNGPVSATLISNKADVTYDEHSVRACGDFLDRSGRVLYGKCVDEKISDEIVRGIRFLKEDREEVVVKNVIIKLADDFIQAVKFKRFELPINDSVGDSVTIKDKAGLLAIGDNGYVFSNIGKIDGIDGDVHMPTWILSIMNRKSQTVEAALVAPSAKGVPKPSSNDNVLVEGMVTNVKDPKKRFNLCDKAQEESVGVMSKQIYYSVVEGLGYPFYDAASFNKALQPIKSAAYGFKPSKEESITPTDLGYCIEPVTKITLDKTEQMDGYSSHKYSLVAGIRVHGKKEVVWKKGLQQSVNISCPDGAGEEYVNYEISKAVCALITGIAQKIEVPTAD